MNRVYVSDEQDFSLSEPNTLGAVAEKNLIVLLLEEDFTKDAWLQRRLACYVQDESWEKDRIVLEVVKFFFQGNLPEDLFTVEREFDSVLAATGKRGHFVHQFEVLIFGWALIRMLINHDRGLQVAFHSDKPREIFSTWMMTAVFHDFGYPLQMAKDIMEKLSTWYQTLGMTEVSELYETLIDKYKTTSAQNLRKLRLQKWDRFDVNTVLYEALQESLKGEMAAIRRLVQDIAINHGQKVHGYTGAIVLCGKCFQSWQAQGLTPTSANFSMVPVKLAMAAILLHDLPDCLGRFIKQIDFRRNPYAYLLMLVDNLQDWYRNLRPNEEWPSYNLVQVNRGTESLELVYVLTHENWTKDMEQRAKKAIREKLGRLRLLTPPDPPLHFHIKAGFRTNRGEPLGDIEISL